jgi:protein-S-isoprenylcysteine O-methyltransferase Ste14
MESGLFAHRVYAIVLTAIFAAAPATLLALLFLEAPYGRFARRGWGIVLPTHWGWRVMELPAALVILLVAIRGSAREPVALLFLVLWEIHYLYRVLVYPLLMRGGDSKTLPMLLVGMAILYNCANGYVNGYRLFVDPRRYPLEWLGDPRFVAGVALFFTGMTLHVLSDRTLRNLRPPGTREYGVPHGGLYSHVSCPNYLGEIVEWCGFALATWSLAGLSFAVFTVANLLPRALATHRWYRRTFPDYPENRKALVPFIL